MTKRERMVATLSGKQADRVPVSPDIAVMVPIKTIGKTFPDVLLRGDPPLWKAYQDTVNYYDFDGFFQYADPHFSFKGESCPCKRIEERDKEGRIQITYIWDTPAGVMRQRVVYPEMDAETRVEKQIKDFAEDFPKLKYIEREFDSIKSTEVYEQQLKYVGDTGAIGAGISPPGLMTYASYMFDGSLEAATYAMYDEPELFEEMNEWWANRSLRHVELLLSLKPKLDFIIAGGSGTITLQSPALFDKLTLPFMKKFAKMCKEAGVISGWHSCGLESHLVKRAAEETDLNFVNPLEIPPMGDCQLKDIKEKYGKKLCLMGNLHTTSVMLLGSPDLVMLRSLEAIRDAGQGGAFILGTGDQPGRDTPPENFRAYVRAAQEFGQYPLDLDRINAEIERLQKICQTK